ncbi:MAG: hypothetical protein ACO1RX_09005 [Candidatus Sericytochromatia bacterium]
MRKALLTMTITLFCLPAIALPGQNYETGRKWLAQHSFFPQKNLTHHLDEYASFGSSRPISENRVLEFKAYHYDGDDRLLFETIAIFNNQDSDMNCLSNIDLNSGAKGYFFESSSSSSFEFNSLWPACTREATTNLSQRGSEDVNKALSLVYEANTPLIKDFKDSKLTYKGKQFFFMQSANGYHDQRSLIAEGPIEFFVYQGKTFDYLATKHTLTIVDKKQRGDWNDWGKLAQFWKKEQDLYDKIKNENNKEKVFDF